MKWTHIIFWTFLAVLTLFAIEAYKVGAGAVSIEQAIATGISNLFSAIGLGGSSTTPTASTTVTSAYPNSSNDPNTFQ